MICGNFISSNDIEWSRHAAHQRQVGKLNLVPGAPGSAGVQPAHTCGFTRLDDLNVNKGQHVVFLLFYRGTMMSSNYSLETWLLYVYMYIYIYRFTFRGGIPSASIPAAAPGLAMQRCHSVGSLSSGVVQQRVVTRAVTPTPQPIIRQDMLLQISTCPSGTAGMWTDLTWNLTGWHLECYKLPVQQLPLSLALLHQWHPSYQWDLCLLAVDHCLLHHSSLHLPRINLTRKLRIPADPHQPPKMAAQDGFTKAK